MSNSKSHWDRVYRTKSATAVSWYQPSLTTSLELIKRMGLRSDARIVDVGSGTSTLVDDLLAPYGAMTQKASQIGTSIEAQNAQDRLAALSGKWNETLKKLTRQNFDSFSDWQAWHNKNKNKPW